MTPTWKWFEPTGCDARELQRHADRIGPIRRQEHPVQIARRQFRQLLRQFDRWNVRVAPRVKRKRAHLLDDGSNHAVIPEADLMNVVAVEIEQPPSAQILDGRTSAAAQHIQARRRERLMQKILCVFIEPSLRFRIDVFGGPLAPLRRDVQIAFRLKECGWIPGCVHRRKFANALPAVSNKSVRADGARPCLPDRHSSLLAAPGRVSHRRGDSWQERRERKNA